MPKINLKNALSYVLQSTTFIAISFLVKYTALFWIAGKDTISNQIFELTYVRNSGAAFSLFSKYTNILIIFSYIILAVIVSYVVKNSKRLSALKITALSALTAGICGNLFERIYDGFVTDYIKLNFISFPVFNSSDILITIGTVLLIITLYKNK